MTTLRLWSCKKVSIAVALTVALSACSGGAGGSGASSNASSQDQIIPNHVRVHPNTSIFDWQSANFDYSTNGSYSATVTCPTGEHILAGGWQITQGAPAEFTILGSYPVLNQHKWEVDLQYFRESGMDVDLTVYADCSTS